MLVTNHPAFGGAHLPDVTVLSPVFADDDSEPLAYVANRAHHAEFGGIAPGSMPPDARSLAEEGVVIPPMLLIESGAPRFEALEDLLRRGPHPSRSPSDNLADLEAQAAANRHGVRALGNLVAAAGRDSVEAHLDSLTARSRDALRKILTARPPVSATALEHLDDGTPIKLTLTPSKDGGLHFDFTGSGTVHPGSLNATPAVVRSAILYALRLFTRSALPLNEGLMEDVTVTVPEGLLNPPFTDDPATCPAVVGGNVETSQRLVDTLLAALHLEACSQGTMNNLVFGDDSFGYYETIAGGSGAGPTYPGTGPLQVHMTNTAITDPEILEHRYPVRLREFSVRHGSGGAGRFPGGPGAVREFEFLAPLSLSLLTQHRESGPYGMEGGQPGRPGKQTLTTPVGESCVLPHSHRLEVKPGTILRIETPGGGGWGTK
jgi:5-oxoprolinase (ATP-hydrolysing)